MTTLYSCRHDGDQYRITKFDSDMNVETSYLLTLTKCECPAGHRPSCRHRHMLPRFIQRGAINSNYLYDYDRGGWVMSDIKGGDDDEVSTDIVPEPASQKRATAYESQSEPVVTQTISEAGEGKSIPFNRRGF